MRDELAKELEKIGLSENEAKVYLAGLELGPSTAQMIAAKATVSRPTTYIMIESLIKRGLMSSFQKGKKRFFLTAAPNQLLYLINNQKRELFEKEKIINQLIQDLARSNQKSSFGEIRIYEGMDGISAMQEDMLKSNGETLYELTCLDEARKFVPPVFEGGLRKKIAAKFRFKTLYTYTKGPLEKSYEKSPRFETRRLDHNLFPIKGEVFICGERVCLASYEDQPKFVMFEDGQMSLTLKTLFLSLWEKGIPE